MCKLTSSLIISGMAGHNEHARRSKLTALIVQHIAMLLADPDCPIEEVHQTAELYFPPDPSSTYAPLFCRVIQGQYLLGAKRFRGEIEAWLEGVDEGDIRQVLHVSYLRHLLCLAQTPQRS